MKQLWRRSKSNSKRSLPSLISLGSGLWLMLGQTHVALASQLQDIEPPMPPQIEAGMNFFGMDGLLGLVLLLLVLAMLLLAIGWVKRYKRWPSLGQCESSGWPGRFSGRFLLVAVFCLHWQLWRAKRPSTQQAWCLYQWVSLYQTTLTRFNYPLNTKQRQQLKQLQEQSAQLSFAPKPLNLDVESLHKQAQCLLKNSLSFAQVVRFTWRKRSWLLWQRSQHGSKE